MNRLRGGARLSPPSRATLLPAGELPATAELVAEGRALARRVNGRRGAFHRHYEVASEIEYKQRRAAAGELMFHSTIGYRGLERTRATCAEVWERLDNDGMRIDRIGVIFDQSMGYPAAERGDAMRGAGLVVDDLGQLARLADCAPVALHFGDFIIGYPNAVENTVAALEAGATAVGNLGQYWCFRRPGRDDEVAATLASVRAIALLAAQPEPVIVHSNLDDGWGSLFEDLACTLGAVLLERHIVEDLLGATLGHCYGHTFSAPLTRLAFQRALVTSGSGYGTMIYGNTTGYRVGAGAETGYAAMASYLLVDMLGQRAFASGHAVNPIPVSEAERIPDTGEIVGAHRFAHRLAETVPAFEAMIDLDTVDETVTRLVQGGRRFRDAVLAGLAAAGVDTRDAVETMLALRRLGARRLEALYGPGETDAGAAGGRRPHVASPVAGELREAATRVLAALDEGTRDAVRARRLVACVASSDVHEYGKSVLERVMAELGVEVVDGGTHAEPRTMAALAREQGADFIALGTYNGFALDYARAVSTAMQDLALDIPVFIGGCLNQVPDASNTSLPADVTPALADLGLHPCVRMEDMLRALATGQAGMGVSRRA